MLALVQLAVEDRAWVLDALGSDDSRNALGALLCWMLDEVDSSRLTVLGFAFSGDLAVLRPICGGASLAAHNLIDLQTLGRQVGENTPSLKKVCARAIGKRLDKEQQCSDWARRPLSRDQFLYAALDAHVLLEMHAALLRA